MVVRVHRRSQIEDDTYRCFQVIPRLIGYVTREAVAPLEPIFAAPCEGNANSVVDIL